MGKSLFHKYNSAGLKFGIYADAGALTCQFHPGSRGHEEEDAQSFAEWGVDYVKYDNCRPLLPLPFVPALPLGLPPPVSHATTRPCKFCRT